MRRIVPSTGQCGGFSNTHMKRSLITTGLGAALAVGLAVTQAPGRLPYGGLMPSDTGDTPVPETVGEAPRRMNMPTPALGKGQLELVGTVLSGKTFDFNVEAGMYRVPWQEGMEFDYLKKWVQASNGAFIVEDTYYAIWTYAPGQYFLTLWDMDGWERIGSNIAVPVEMTSTALARDPQSGLVYGSWYNAQGTGFEYGAADFSDPFNPQRTTVSSLQVPWNAAAFTRDGTLYAIDYEGQLLTVDTSTGTLTKVGDTGVKPKYATGGAYDPKSGTFYWAVANDDEGALYTVDLATARASLVQRFGNRQEVCGMVVIPVPDDNAPASATNLTANYPEGALDGNISFTLPSLTYMDAPLGGNVQWRVTVDGDQHGSGTGQPGEAVALATTLTRGTHQITVHVANSHGDGERTRLKFIAGAGDKPAPPQPQVANLDATTLQVSWPPVTTGDDGTYIVPSEVTYTVTRMPANKTVASDLAECSFTDQSWEGNPEAWWYEVKARYRKKYSAIGSSPKAVVGVITLPYAHPLDKEGDLDIYTAIDANGDGQCVSWFWGHNGFQWSTASSAIPMDDWLVTQPIWLEGGRKYLFSIDVWSSSAKDSQFQRFEACYGPVPDPEHLTIPLIAMTEVWERSPKTHYGVLVPLEDGYYHIGLHNTADNNMWRMELRNLAISAALDAVPAMEPASASAVPDYDGGLTTRLLVTAPTVGMDHAPLQQLDYVVALCGGKEIWRTPAAPGEQLQFDWTAPEAGEQQVEIYGETASLPGLASTLTFWAGVPPMNAPEGITALETERTGEVQLKWLPVTTDIYGHSRNPLLAAYEVCLSDSTLLHGPLTGTEACIRLCDEGQQVIARLLVGTRTEAGVTYAQAPVTVAGTPWTAPWRETWPGRYAAWSHQLEGDGDWWVYGDQSIPSATSYEGDNGYMVHYCTAYGAEGVMTTGKIDLDGLAKPMASLRLLKYASGADTNENTVALSVITSDGTEAPVDSWRMRDLPYTNWNMVTADLSAFAGQTVRLCLHSVIRSLSMNFIDDLRVTENCDKNLAAGDVALPAKVLPGSPVTVDVRVDNMGAKRSGKYTATLWRNGVQAQTQERRAVAVGSSDWFIFEDTANGGDVPSVTYAVTLSMDGDGYAADDRAEAVMAVTGTTYPAVNDLSATCSGGTVHLVWGAPSAAAGPQSELRCDDFEDAAAWKTEYRNWTFTDADRSPVGSVEGIDFPGISNGSLQSFWVHDATHPNALKDRFGANSGTRYLASMFRSDEGMADDWAISPQLDPAAQTIAFAARSFDGDYPETVEVLVSHTGTDVAEFTPVAEFTSIPSEWTRHTVVLPQGSRHFALRSKAVGGFMLFLDDIEFNAAAGSAVSLRPAGYNIYRNGVLLNAAPASACEWSDVPGDCLQPTYVVTAVYDLGESAPSNAVTITDGVKTPVSGLMHVEGARGSLTVNGCAGRQITVSDCNGTVRYSGKVTHALTLRLEPGIYIVAAGGDVVKAVVR